MAQYYPTQFTVDELSEATTSSQISESPWLGARRLPRTRRALPGGESEARDVEREVMLQIIDQRWREHLAEMDYLREGINLRAMGQQDPLVAWQREGFEMFGRMIDGIDDDYLRYVMHVQAVSQPAEEPDLTQASYQAAEDPLEGPSLLDVFRATAAERASLGDGNARPVGVGPGTSGDGAGHEASRAVGAAGPSRPAGPVTANVGRDGRTPRYSTTCRSRCSSAIGQVAEREARAQREVLCGSGKKFKLCHGGS